MFDRKNNNSKIKCVDAQNATRKTIAMKHIPLLGVPAEFLVFFGVVATVILLAAAKNALVGVFVDDIVNILFGVERCDSNDAAFFFADPVTDVPALVLSP